MHQQLLNAARGREESLVFATSCAQEAMKDPELQPELPDFFHTALRNLAILSLGMTKAMQLKCGCSLHDGAKMTQELQLEGP